MQGITAKPKVQNESSNTNQTALNSSYPVSTSNTATGGVNASQGAVNINPENALERWNRLEASGELENLTGDDYYNLANAATAIENAMSPVSSFYRFNRVVNSTNQYAASLAADLSRKQYNVDMMQQRVASNQVWVDQNTNKLGGITQGFDLEAMIGRTTDWTDMSYDLTPGPWRDGYVFGAENTVGSSLISNIASTNTVASAFTGTGLLLMQGQFEPLNNNWTQGFMMQNSVPVNHMRTPAYNSNSVNIISNSDWVFDSTKYAITPDFINYDVVGAGMDKLGQGMTGLGMGLSVYSAYDATYGNKNGFDQADMFREGGKLGMDTMAALTSIPKLARFSPAGLAYTAADILVQFTPDYTVQHGQYKGQVKTGWTKLMYTHGDVLQANQILNKDYRMFDLGKI